MKNFKKVLALVLVLATLMGLATVAGAAYEDENKISADYTEAVKVLELIETMEGYPDGEFKPTNNITREEAAKLIAIFDNKDSDIKEYYTSINPFADEKGRWGESYVGYGFRAGIIGGRNATTFDPTANVTGTEFLKMALVTLGYDAEAEGFVGASWAVNVLSLARRLDLIDGLAKTWKPEDALTREEAAQILLNTLKADTVEYGSEVKAFLNKDSFDLGANLEDGMYFRFNGKLYATVAGAVTTGKKLYEGFKLSVAESHDAFYRPQTKWTVKNGDSVKVMFPVEAQYTTRFSVCDLLVDLGVAKNDTDSVVYIDEVYRNGALVWEASTLANGEISHTTSVCDREANKLGAQGTLTQVFRVGETKTGEPIYRICMIETWLAKVKSVSKKTTARDEHVKSEGAVKFETLYTINEGMGYWHDYCDGEDARYCGTLEEMTYDDPTGLAKGDYVLINYSWDTNAVEIVEVADSKDAKFSGYKMDAVSGNPTQTRVDGEFVKDAVHFHMGYEMSKDQDYGTYTFYFDAYGNVIGMKEASTTTDWAVVDRMYISYNKGTAAMNADVVGLDAKTTEATVAELLDIDGADFNDLTVADIYAHLLLNGWFDEEYEPNADPENYKSFSFMYDHLFEVSVNADGEYTINNSEDVKNLRGEIKVVNSKPYVLLNGDEELTLTADTQILVHQNDGTYVAFTGYKNVKSMIAHYAEYVMDDDNEYVDVLYLCDDVFMTDGKFNAYVGTPSNYWAEEKVNGKTYYGVEIYVNGEKDVVYVDRYDMEEYFTSVDEFERDSFVPGFYQFQYITIDEVDTARVLKSYVNSGEDYLEQLIDPDAYSFNGDVLKIDGHSYALADDCAAYLISDDMSEVTKSTVEEVTELHEEGVNDDCTNTEYAHFIYAELNDDDEVVAIYFVLADNE